MSFQNIAHFPFVEDGFVFFNWRKGISLIPREKKGFYGYGYRTILHFLNVHDSCTLSVCDQKLWNNLIKGTDYTPDFLGSIKNDGFQQNI